MAFQFSAGRYANFLTRLRTAPVQSSSDALYPVAGLYDGRANMPTRWAAATADCNVYADLCPWGDPSFEAGVSEWTQVSGTMDQSGTQKATGSYSARFTAAGSYYYEFSARAGEARTISAWLYGGGGSCAAVVRVYCVETGHYLQSGGASWAAGSSNVLSRTTASGATSTQAYTVEPLSTTFADVVTLRVYVAQENAGTTYRDDVTDLPAVTFSSVHGHNFGAALTPKVQSSPDNVTWTDRITPTLRRDVIWGTVAATYVRYWRLLLSGTPGAIPWAGEWWLGQYGSFTCAPDYPLTIEYDDHQTRAEAGDGAQSVYLRGGAPIRRVAMVFRPRNDAEYQQLRDEVWRASRGGRYPMILVPTETDSDTCIMGRLVDSVQVQRTSYALRGMDLEMMEEPLPQMG